ncbi:hypothetical protein FQY83_06805 [Luteimonas marina]|uniref:Uncharacterized protein n=1 Tax=Luteimonas marina TaxID=488485 RepID=A0A5C5U4S4_9GAMM|nr:hypothetical protein [Luteimonas marina]TWT21067.1 hypothetical protein FQY83_06805 [Luteimonas marina]
MNDSVLKPVSPSLPADLRTGDQAIDRYLAQINAHLIGTRSVRRMTLVEARDFVVDASIDAPDRGAAILAATGEFGSPEDIGSTQRRERHGVLLKIALMAGPAFALLMLLMQVLGLSAPGGWRSLAIVFVWNMLAFGLGMGALFAYAIGTPAPSKTAPATATGENGFVATYLDSSRMLCRILFAVFGSMQLLLLLSLFGADPTGIFNAWAWPLTAFLLFVNFKNVAAPLHALRFRAEATPGTLRIHRLTGPLLLQRRQIVTVARPSYLRQAFSMLYGQQHRIGWRADDGRLRHVTVSLTPDVINGGRLRAWLEAAADENAART